MIEPKPCPFCGHVGLDFREGETFRWLEYSCGGCGIRTEVRIQTLGDGTPEEWAEQAKRDAIEEWNRREGQARDASVYSVAAPVTPSGAAGEDLIDAERYRWIKSGNAEVLFKRVEHWGTATGDVWSRMPSTNELDAAIDAARKSGEAKK